MLYLLHTGYFVCPKCNVHGDWNILERLVKKVKLDASLKDFIEKCQQEAEQFQKDWETLICNTVQLSSLSNDELLDLFLLFEYPVSIVIEYFLLR